MLQLGMYVCLCISLHMGGVCVCVCVYAQMCEYIIALVANCSMHDLWFACRSGYRDFSMPRTTMERPLLMWHTRSTHQLRTRLTKPSTRHVLHTQYHRYNSHYASSDNVCVFCAFNKHWLAYRRCVVTLFLMRYCCFRCSLFNTLGERRLVELLAWLHVFVCSWRLPVARRRCMVALSL